MFRNSKAIAIFRQQKMILSINLQTKEVTLIFLKISARKGLMLKLHIYTVAEFW
jgi:hypothetical protein